jgi:hypothetical protein
MTKLKRIFQWQTEVGDKLTVGDITLTPQSQALVIRWPNGGLVWNRPVGVLVEQGEHKLRLPIVDVTRLAQLWLFGISVLLAVIWLISAVLQRRK